MTKKKLAKSDSVNDTWQRIELWLAEHAKPLAKSLAKGASVDQLQKLEATLNVTLPQEFKDSLTIHDGQKEDHDFVPDEGIGSFYLLRSKDIPRVWKDLNAVHAAGDFDDAIATPDKGIAKSWWNSGWIPFGSNGGGDLLCLDLSPAKSGAAGQITMFRHDSPVRRLIASSFGVWLRELAETIENGGIDYLLESRKPGKPSFKSLDEALSLIEMRLQDGFPVGLFSACIQDRQSEYMNGVVFERLQAIHAKVGLRSLYLDASPPVAFPTNAKTFTLGGHDKELGHIHIDFRRVRGRWQLDEVWMCR